MFYILKDAKKPNHDRVKSLYVLKLTLFWLGRSKFTPPKRKLRYKSTERPKVEKNEWFTLQKMLKKPNRNMVKSLYDLKLTLFRLGGGK